MTKKVEFVGGRSHLNPDGSETLDPRPVEMPVGFERPPSIQELIRRLVTEPQIREELDSRGVETFDEADDFEIPEDEPISPHEVNFDPLHLLTREQEIASGTVAARTPQEIRAAQKAIEAVRARIAKKEADSAPAGAGSTKA